MAGEKPFCVIDTEARRALHYGDSFRFDHCDLKPPFSPHAYAEAIAAADAAGYPVIVVDSCSHEHAGEGGILDIQEAEFARLGNKDSAKMLSWATPKREHKKMVQRLLQIRAHLILCFRAEEKIEMARNADGRMEVRKKQTATGLDGWQPICEKTLPYELTASFLLMAAKPGVPLPIKLQEQHRALFPLDKPITEESGKLIAAWAAGGKKLDAKPNAESNFVSPDQAINLEDKLKDAGIDKASLLGAMQKAGLDATSISLLPSAAYQRALDWIGRAASK